MTPKIREFIRRHVVSRLRGSYTRALEAEVARLRAENRALVNSILGLAGIPPMRVADVRSFAGPSFAPPQNAVAKGGNTDYRAAATNCVKQDHASHRSASSRADAPLRSVRRRSWRQIGRALEIEDALAARRERESDTDTFPAPRNIVPRM